MPQIKHVVLMRLRPDVTQESIDDFYADLARLRKLIPGIVEFSGSANASQEGLSQGFTHGFVMTFTGIEARDVYLTHPDHEKVKLKILALLDGGVAGAIVVDWSDSLDNPIRGS